MFTSRGRGKQPGPPWEGRPALWLEGVVAGGACHWLTPGPLLSARQEGSGDHDQRRPGGPVWEPHHCSNRVWDRRGKPVSPQCPELLTEQLMNTPRRRAMHSHHSLPVTARTLNIPSFLLPLSPHGLPSGVPGTGKRWRPLGRHRSGLRSSRRQAISPPSLVLPSGPLPSPCCPLLASRDPGAPLERGRAQLLSPRPPTPCPVGEGTPADPAGRDVVEVT